MYYLYFEKLNLRKNSVNCRWPLQFCHLLLLKDLNLILLLLCWVPIILILLSLVILYHFRLFCFLFHCCYFLFYRRFFYFLKLTFFHFLHNNILSHRVLYLLAFLSFTLQTVRLLLDPQSLHLLQRLQITKLNGSFVVLPV